MLPVRRHTLTPSQAVSNFPRVLLLANRAVGPAPAAHSGRAANVCSHKCRGQFSNRRILFGRHRHCFSFDSKRARSASVKQIRTVALTPQTQQQEQQQNECGAHKLADCASSNDVSGIRALQLSNSDLTGVVKDGKTALMVAAECGHVEAAQELLVSGALIEARDHLCGDSALGLAVANGQHAMVTFLLESGSDVEARDNSGMTALMVAASTNDLEAAKTLLKYGADVDATDGDGKSVRDYVDKPLLGSADRTDMATLLGAEPIQPAIRWMDVFADRRMGQPMRYYNVLTKFCGGMAHCAVNGALISLICEDSGVMSSIPTVISTTVFASAVVIPPYYFLSVRLRRILDRHVQAIAIPMPVVISHTAAVESDLEQHEKDALMNVYNQVVRSKRLAIEEAAEASQGKKEPDAWWERLRKWWERLSASPVQRIFDLRKRLSSFFTQQQPDDENKDAATECEIETVDRQDLMDHFRHELGRPLSLVREGLELKPVLTPMDHERLDAVFEVLATDPTAAAKEVTADEWLRWCRRTVAFCKEQNVEDSLIDLSTYDPWGEKPPPAPQTQLLENICLFMEKWIGANEFVTVQLKIKVTEDAAVVSENGLLTLAQMLELNGVDKPKPGEYFISTESMPQQRAPRGEDLLQRVLRAGVLPEAPTVDDPSGFWTSTGHLITRNKLKPIEEDWKSVWAMKTSEDLLQKTNQILPKSMQLAENGEAALLQKSMGRFGPETFVRLSRAQELTMESEQWQLTQQFGLTPKPWLLTGAAAKDAGAEIPVTKREQPSQSDETADNCADSGAEKKSKAQSTIQQLRRTFRFAAAGGVLLTIISETGFWVGNPLLW